MQAKWHGHSRMTSFCTLLSTVTASAQLWSKEFRDFLGSRHTMMEKRLLFFSPWVELRRLLSESQSSSSERRRTHGTLKMNSWRFFEGSSTSAIVRRQRPAPGQVMLHQQQLEQAACFLLACQWPKIVQPRTGWRHARQQPDFLLLFGTCGDSSSGTKTGDGAAEWIKTIVLSSPFSSTSNRRTALKLGTTDLRGLRNTLVQKIRNLSPPKIRLLISPRLP